GSIPTKKEFEPQSSSTPQEFEPTDSGSSSGFVPPEVEQFESADEVESQGSGPGLWEHSADGWTPPTVDQAWERAEDDDGWGALFDHAPTPARRILPLQP